MGAFTAAFWAAKKHVAADGNRPMQVFFTTDERCGIWDRSVVTDLGKETITTNKYRVRLGPYVLIVRFGYGHRSQILLFRDSQLTYDERRHSAR